MSGRIARVVDSTTFLVITLAAFAAMLVVSVPILFTKEGRQKVDPEYVEDFHATAATVEPNLSVVVYGDSRGAFFGEGAQLVAGWYPVTNEAREGCAFLGQDHIWRQYGTEAAVSERSTSEQGDGTNVECDTRTYITADTPHYDLAIVYAGTLFTVNGGTTNEVHSPVEGFMSPDTVGWWSYLTHNLTETLERINADTIVVLGTPTSTSTWDGIGDPYWDDPDRLMAVNSILFTASHRAGAIFLPDFARWVEAQPAECQPDGSHFSVGCAAQAGAWIRDQLATMEAAR